MNKKNELIDNTEFEQELKEKMKELSSSVDCFGKISARAFPEKETFFSDSEFTVSDLENVTDKRRTPPFMKWAAVAAAAVICVCVIPKTAPFRDFLAELGNNGDNEYSLLVSEILNETSKEGYTFYDVPLKRYICYDMLVDPLYDCPFGQSDDTDAKVRMFVRTYKNIPTNQIYAIEYTGEFADGHFLAAAKSGAIFTERELSDIADSAVWGDMSEKNSSAVSSSFTANKYGATVKKNGDDEAVTAVATYEKKQIFKLNGETMLLSTGVIYSYNMDTDEYSYDISCCKNVDGSFVSVDIPQSDKLWKYSFNYDGLSAMQKERGSYFVRKNYYSQPQVRDEFDTIKWFEPFSLIDDSYCDNNIQTIGGSENLLGMIYTPADAYLKRTMRYYISDMYYYFSSDSDPAIRVVIDGPESNIAFNVHKGDLESAVSKGES